MTNLQDPNNIEALHQAGKYAPGFFGALIATYHYSKPASKLEAAGSVLAGAVSATYLGPWVAHILAPQMEFAESGVHFLVGAATVVLVPVAVRKMQELIGQINWAGIGEWLKWKKPPQ